MQCSYVFILNIRSTLYAELLSACAYSDHERANYRHMNREFRESLGLPQQGFEKRDVHISGFRDVRREMFRNMYLFL